MTPPQHQQRGDIQGLRAIAVGLVVAAHLATYQAPGLHRLDGGFLGVDVFFVLSGYLITGLLLREAETTGRISLVAFYGRRARRILPAATLTLVAVVAYAGLRLPHSQLVRIVPDAWWSALFLANWHFAHAGTSYFDPTYLSPLQHFWSLAVEEQFYLVWPVLLLVAVRLGRSRRTLAALVAVAIAASLAWSIHATHADPSAAYFSTPARIYELALGTLLAVLRPATLRRPVRLLLGLVGLAALAVATLRLGANAPFPGWEALIPTTATGLLLVAGQGSPTIVTRLLCLRPLRYLGDVSYSLYLWHFPVIVLAMSGLPSGWSLRERLPLELALMLALAIGSYHLVEQPFRRRRPRLVRTDARTLVLWPTALALILVSTLGAGAWSAHTEHQQTEASQSWWATHPSGPTTPTTATPSLAALQDELRQAVALDHQGAPVPPTLQPTDEAHDYWGAAYPCFADYGDTTAPDCAYGDTTSSVVVAAVGDSHMGMWLPALDALGKAQQVKIVPLVKVSCAPYAVYQPGKQMGQAECDAFRSWTLTRLQQLRPDAIITTARGELFMHPRDGTSVATQWSDGVRRTLTAYRAVTADVTVLGDVPSRPNPDDCLSRPGTHLLDCEAAPTSKESRSNPLTAQVAGRLGLTWVATQQLACDGATCPLVADDTRVYHDTSHLTLAWVRHATTAFGTLLGPLAAGTGVHARTEADR